VVIAFTFGVVGVWDFLEKAEAAFCPAWPRVYGTGTATLSCSRHVFDRGMALAWAAFYSDDSSPERDWLVWFFEIATGSKYQHGNVRSWSGTLAARPFA